MATYSSEVIWSRSKDEKFVDGRYSRRHILGFDGGIEVPGSASPLVVPLPYSATEAVDPEEAFVSAIASCHMLWFLSIAAAQGLVVDRYHDIAEGVMASNAAGKLMISRVTLHPAVELSGKVQPSAAELLHLNQRAHAECFIANSVKTRICLEPRASTS